MSENKVMKSLNGYEVVDAQARADIEEIKSGGSSSNGGLQTHYIKAQTYGDLTNEDREILIKIYDSLSLDGDFHNTPPDDLILYCCHMGFYHIVDSIAFTSSNATTYYIKLHLSGTSDGDVWYTVGILKSDKSVSSFAKTVIYPQGNGLDIQYSSIGYSFYGDNNVSSDNYDFGIDPEKTVMVVLEVQDTSGGGMSSVTMGRVDGWNWYGSTTLVDCNGEVYTFWIQIGTGVFWYAMYSANGTSQSVQINSVTKINNP